VSFVAVAKPLEGHPNGVLVQITVRAVAVPRRLVVLESSGHVLRTREPSFLGTVVGFAERRLSDTGSFRRCSAGISSRAAAVLVLVALEQEESLLGKGNTAVQGAGVVAVLLRTGATSARTTAAGGAATVVIVVAVVDRDQQLESVVKRGCGLVDEALFEAHCSVVVQFLSAKEMKTALLGGAHGISSGGSSSRSGSGR